MKTITGLELNLFERAGYFVRRGLAEPAVVQECLAAADRVTEKLRTVRLGQGRADPWDANNLLRPETREPAFVRLLADEELLSIVEDLLGPSAAFYEAKLLADNAGVEVDTRSHHDLARDLESLRERRVDSRSRWQDTVLLCLALLSDESLWVVPGTHVAHLLPEQTEAVKRDPLGDVPGLVCVRLAPGDVLVRDARLLHRTRYPQANPLRTLHYAYIGPGYPRESIPPRPWLEDETLLRSLPPRARAFIDRFISGCS